MFAILESIFEFFVGDICIALLTGLYNLLAWLGRGVAGVLFPTARTRRPW